MWWKKKEDKELSHKEKIWIVNELLRKIAKEIISEQEQQVIDSIIYKLDVN